MRRLVLSLLLAVTLLAGCTPQATLPWITFSESAQDAVGSQMGMCTVDGQFVEVMVAQLAKDGNGYRMFSDTKTVLFLVYLGDKEDAQPDYALVGKVNPEKNDVIPPLTKVSIEDAKKKWPTICEVFSLEA